MMNIRTRAKRLVDHVQPNEKGGKGLGPHLQKSDIFHLAIGNPEFKKKNGEGKKRFVQNRKDKDGLIEELTACSFIKVCQQMRF